jgi:glycerophosphoryl diester phosphodiesterase
MPELQRVRQTDPDAKIMVLQHRRLPPDPVADVVALDASHVGLHFSTVTPMLLQTYHNLGRQVFVYTVNESQTSNACATWAWTGSSPTSRTASELGTEQMAYGSERERSRHCLGYKPFAICS